MIFAFTFLSLYLLYKYTIFQVYDANVLALEKQIEELEEINSELIKQTEYKNSNAYIEKLARENLGLLKSYEIIFIDIGN